ncbi:MAG: ABC transporter permease, partial [Verrucomicrobia bacterium]|nr:ABC transporter permease [Cytophagales bacterium]
MLRNYLTIALRNLLKNRVFSVINISGLGLGIAAFVFILQYLSFEQSVNKFHVKSPDLYRVLFESDRAKRETWESTV